MLQNSMGCPDTFEYRREELRALNLPSGDDDVAASFLSSISPDGPLTQFISMGKLGLLLHDTLFVHGAVLEHSMG